MPGWWSLYNKMIPELRDHILSFLSSDSLLPPNLLELSKLLQRQRSI